MILTNSYGEPAWAIVDGATRAALLIISQLLDQNSDPMTMKKKKKSERGEGRNKG